MLDVSTTNFREDDFSRDTRVKRVRSNGSFYETKKMCISVSDLSQVGSDASQLRQIEKQNAYLPIYILYIYIDNY